MQIITVGQKHFIFQLKNIRIHIIIKYSDKDVILFSVEVEGDTDSVNLCLRKCIQVKDTYICPRKSLLSDLEDINLQTFEELKSYLCLCFAHFSES